MHVFIYTYAYIYAYMHTNGVLFKKILEPFSFIFCVSFVVISIFYDIQKKFKYDSRKLWKHNKKNRHTGENLVDSYKNRKTHKYSIDININIMHYS
jgi:hypothetical protein